MLLEPPPSPLPKRKVQLSSRPEVEPRVNDQQEKDNVPTPRAISYDRQVSNTTENSEGGIPPYVPVVEGRFMESCEGGETP